MQLNKVGVRLQYRDDGTTHVIVEGELENGQTQELGSARVPDVEGDFYQQWELSEKTPINNMSLSLLERASHGSTDYDRALHLTRVLAEHLRRTFPELEAGYEISSTRSVIKTKVRFETDFSYEFHVMFNYLAHIHISVEQWLADNADGVVGAYHQLGHHLLRRWAED